MSMFRDIADEHKKMRDEKRTQIRQLETKILDQSIPEFNKAIFSELNNGGDKIVANQREIDRRCKAVRTEWQDFNNELTKWTSMINDLDKAVKEIGDIQSWSVSIQGQIQDIVSQLASKSQSQ